MKSHRVRITRATGRSKVQKPLSLRITFAQCLGWPLGATELRAPTVSSNILGDVKEPEPATLSGVESVLKTPHTQLHWYGKHNVRPLRKMGHVTVTDPTADPDNLAARSNLLDHTRETVSTLTFTQSTEEQ